jgi:type IX secretion system PorP/SprF family membrane protein
MGNYRSQWTSVPVSYMTVSGSADFKFYDKRLRNTLFSGGVLFNYDEAGFSSLNLAELGLSTSLTQQLTNQHFLTLGVQATAAQRSFSMQDLTFDNQFDGDQFNPDLDPRENFQGTSNFYTSFSVGANWHFQIPDKRVSTNVGIGFFHLNQPGVSFLEDETVLLPARFSLYGLGTFGIAENLDVLLRFHSLQQEDFNALMLGAGLRAHLSKTRTRELAVVFGADYRLGDAMIPNARLEYGSWAFGLSYDINTSNFKNATNGNGGFECSLRYIFTSVKPLDAHKICPIF